MARYTVHTAYYVYDCTCVHDCTCRFINTATGRKTWPQDCGWLRLQCVHNCLVNIHTYSLTYTDVLNSIMDSEMELDS